MYILDGAMMNTQERAHEHLRTALGFPDYYGRNLDALFDCLSDLHGEIRLYHASLLRRAMPVYAEKILRVLKDAQEESDALTVTVID